MLQRKYKWLIIFWLHLMSLIKIWAHLWVYWRSFSFRAENWIVDSKRQKKKKVRIIVWDPVVSRTLKKNSYKSWIRDILYFIPVPSPVNQVLQIILSFCRQFHLTNVFYSAPFYFHFHSLNPYQTTSHQTPTFFNKNSCSLQNDYEQVPVLAQLYLNFFHLKC